MKKMILVLATIIGLVSTASAKTTYAGKTKNGADRYTVENNRIGKITYSVGVSEVSEAYAFLGRPDEFFENSGLDPEVEALTKKYGATVGIVILENGPCYTVANVYSENKLYCLIWW